MRKSSKTARPSPLASTACVVGIDVAARWLDIAVLPSRRQWRVPNDAAGIVALRHDLLPLAPERIVLEATGGYERAVLIELHEAGLPVVRVKPIQVHAFRAAAGQQAKTDRLDALLLAEYGRDMPPPVRPVASEAQRRLRDLLNWRTNLLQMRSVDTQRAQHLDLSVVTRMAAHQQWITTELEAVEELIATAITVDPVLAAKVALLITVPGIATTTAVTVLTILPELGTLDRGAIGALAGVVPFANDSGTRRKHRHARGGRGLARAALHMACLSATRFNPVIKAFHDRLAASQKPKMVMLLACAHKLLTILNAMVRDNRPWDPENAMA